MRKFVEACGCLVLVLVFIRGDELVHGHYGCCSEEAVGSEYCKALDRGKEPIKPYSDGRSDPRGLYPTD